MTEEDIPISIHALLAESDSWATCGPAGGRTFLSTLSLRRATCQGLLFFRHKKFLSTLSLRRATVVKMSIKFFNADFYPRSPCGERRSIDIITQPGCAISIHALLAESDANISLPEPCYMISIHALLAESDPPKSILVYYTAKFLSTLSLRRATT